jgi:hypothetical protein
MPAGTGRNRCDYMLHIASPVVIAEPTIRTMSSFRPATVRDAPSRAALEMRRERVVLLVRGGGHRAAAAA